MTCLALKYWRARVDSRCMTSEPLGIPGPLTGDITKRKIISRGVKLKAAAIAASPVALVGLLCVVDSRTAGQQKVAECTSTQQAVTVPKPHIWGAGAIMGAADTPTALRDVMARTHPDIALTAIVAANPSLALAPMGNVPATYGGRACLTVPSTGKGAVRVDPKGPRRP